MRGLFPFPSNWTVFLVESRSHSCIESISQSRAAVSYISDRKKVSRTPILFDVPGCRSTVAIASCDKYSRMNEWFFAFFNGIPFNSSRWYESVGSRLVAYLKKERMIPNLWLRVTGVHPISFSLASRKPRTTTRLTSEKTTVSAFFPVMLQM